MNIDETEQRQLSNVEKCLSLLSNKIRRAPLKISLCEKRLASNRIDAEIKKRHVAGVDFRSVFLNVRDVYRKNRNKNHCRSDRRINAREREMCLDLRERGIQR
jgi:hypothetical protein